MWIETLKSSNEKGKSKNKTVHSTGWFKMEKVSRHLIQEDDFQTASYVITKKPERETKSLQAVDWNISKSSRQ